MEVLSAVLPQSKMSRLARNTEKQVPALHGMESLMIDSAICTQAAVLSFAKRYYVCSQCPSRAACSVVFPYATATSICRSRFTISSGLYIFFAIFLGSSIPVSRSYLLVHPTPGTPHPDRFELIFLWTIPSSIQPSLDLPRITTGISDRLHPQSQQP
jgi:hypothetical protein